MNKKNSKMNCICDESARFYNRMGKVTEIEDDDFGVDVVNIKGNPYNEYLQKAIAITDALAVELERDKLLKRISSLYVYVNDRQCIDQRYIELLNDMYFDYRDNHAEHDDIVETVDYIDGIVKAVAPYTTI